MTHFACNGDCGGVSEAPGTCQAETCSLHDQPLTACECDNPTHAKEEEAAPVTEAPVEEVPPAAPLA